MKVSIVIPIYNVKNYIVRCVESCIYQSYKDLEIILVNDGSMDGSRELIQKFEGDERVVIVDKENRGLSDARNEGIKRSTGDYILFVDGDDYVEKDTVKVLIDEAYKGFEIVLFPYIKEYISHREKRRLMDSERVEFDESEVRCKIFARLIGPSESICQVDPLTMDNLNTAWGKLYKKELIRGIDFLDTEIIGPEDCWFNILAFRDCKCAVYTENTWYHYEKSNSNSLLHKYNKGLLEKRWNMYNLVKKNIEDSEEIGLLENLYNREVCELYSLMSNIFLSELSGRNKREEAKCILCDERYITPYEKCKLGRVKLLWKSFYELCHRQSVAGVEFFFILLKIAKTIRKS